MEAKQILDALKTATPEQREAIKSAVRNTATKSLLMDSGLKFTERNGKWSLTGTPDEWTKFLAK